MVLLSIRLWIVSIFLSINTVKCDTNDYLKNRGGEKQGSQEAEEYCEKLDDSSVHCTSKKDVQLYRLPGGEIGHIELLEVAPGKTLEMKTVSTKPLVFEIPHFLSAEECQHFIEVSKKEGLKASETISEATFDGGITLRDTNRDKILSLDEMRLTIEDSFDIYPDIDDIKKMYKDMFMDKNDDDLITPDELRHTSPGDINRYLVDFIKKHPEKHSRMSKQIWLFPDASTDEIFTKVQDRVQNLVKLPNALIKKSDFQVVTYGVDGHYNAHHDSTPIPPKGDSVCCTRKRTKNCRICRYMTVLFYLNDVEEGGGTAFPLAGNETYDETKFRLSGNVNLFRNCDSANLIVGPQQGKAVIWYNHFVDKETGWLGEMDQFTWHGGCPIIKGEKWIANFWIKATDSKDDDLKS